MAPRKLIQQSITKTRNLFASTHWGQGEYEQVVDFGEGEKMTWCAVGGLRHVTLGDSSIGESTNEAYTETLFAVAYAINSERALEYLDEIRSENESDQIHGVNELESIVVEWNDDEDTILDNVLAVFDAAVLVEVA